MTDSERQKVESVLQTSSEIAKLKIALQEFIDAIEATGGVMKDAEGYTVPVADEEWIDLGEAYLEACSAIGKRPKYQR